MEVELKNVLRRKVSPQMRKINIPELTGDAGIEKKVSCGKKKRLNTGFCQLKSPEKNGMDAVVENEAQKLRLRQEYSSARRALDADTRRKYDAAICENLRSLRCFQESGCVAGFISHGAEPDISSLFKGKRLFLPRFDMRRGVYEMVAVEDLELDLLPGKYNIPEPSQSLPAADPEFVASQVLFLVPAVACDRRGNRLGRGGGYYDRLLAGVKISPVAVVYSCQLHPAVLPGTAHDVPMGTVVTERGVINCRREEE